MLNQKQEKEGRKIKEEERRFENDKRENVHILSYKVSRVT